MAPNKALLQAHIKPLWCHKEGLKRILHIGTYQSTIKNYI